MASFEKRSLSATALFIVQVRQPISLAPPTARRQ